MRHCSKKPFKKVTHCLFDMDGTILGILNYQCRNIVTVVENDRTNSEIIYHEAITEICKRYGKIYDEELRTQMYGLTDRQLSEAVVLRLDLPLTADEFSRLLGDSVKKLLPTIPMKEGVDRLFKHLYKFRIPFALVTNSTASSVQTHAISRPKLFNMFHHKVCITDMPLGRGKPSPEIYLTACSRFCPTAKPVECLVFEDSEVGVEAGLSAGMQVVMIPDPRLKKNLNFKATLVLKSLLDFKPELFGLPPFNDAITPVKR